MPNIEKATNTQDFQWQKSIIIASSIILTAISIAIITSYFFSHYIPIDQIQHLLNNIHHIPYATSYIVGGSIGLSIATPIAAMIHSVSSQKDKKASNRNANLQAFDQTRKVKRRAIQQENITQEPSRDSIIEEIQKSFKTLKKSPLEYSKIAELLQEANQSKANIITELDTTFQRDKIGTFIEKVEGFDEEVDLDKIIELIDNNSLKNLIKLGCTQSLSSFCITQPINDSLKGKNLLLITELDKGSIIKNKNNTYEIKHIIKINYVIYRNKNHIKLNQPLQLTATFIITKDNDWQINSPNFSIV
jgi:hypothetical protein